MKPLTVLVSGVPRAGKSSFADAVEASRLQLTHVPMDKYIMPIPEGQTFLQWVKRPACVDWELLGEHLDVLSSGRVCFTPQPDWSDRGRRFSEGGPVVRGPGREMHPREHGYIIPGTHIFSLPERDCRRVTVYIDIPAQVLASRLEGQNVSAEAADTVVRGHLGDNPDPLRALLAQADLVIDGTTPHEEQVDTLFAQIQSP